MMRNAIAIEMGENDDAGATRSTTNSAKEQ